MFDLIVGIIATVVFFWVAWLIIDNGLSLPTHVEGLRVELYDGEGFQKWKCLIFPLYILLWVLSLIFQLLLGAVVVGAAYDVAKHTRDWWHDGKK